MMNDFTSMSVETGDANTFITFGGDGPAVLLLHGFPETHLMWRDVAPLLATEFTVVAADLRGYGQSSVSSLDPDSSTFSKRAMASDMVTVMREALGVEQFSVVGHDRGGRVAYRMALDHPDVVRKLAVLDIVPIADAWDNANDELAVAFWPWSLLAQPSPLPESILQACASQIVSSALDGWGSDGSAFPSDVRAAYEGGIGGEHAHAVCEEYRAAASIDRQHDAEDRQAGHRISCPVHVSWSKDGGLNRWYDNLGGPLGVWRQWADDVSGGPVEGGHFFAEEHPDRTARELGAFLGT